jgi:hypothetical protein
MDRNYIISYVLYLAITGVLSYGVVLMWSSQKRSVDL